MDIFWKILLAVAIAFSVPTYIDFIIYSIKSAPKNATMTIQFWITGFLCSIHVIYRMLP